MSRSMGLLAAGLLAAGVVSTCLGDTAYHSKSLNPVHLRDLQQSIQQCAERVNFAPDIETRGQYQEELCKLLVQAEDYDNALCVAKAICNTPRISAERRAVHHFMIAQICAMKMEASPTLELMEQNRRLAAASAQEVLAQRYPRKWMVGDEATRLLKELQDPQHMKEVRAWVEKRQTGGAGKSSATRTQTAALGKAIAGQSVGAQEARYSAPQTQAATAQPARDALMDKLGLPYQQQVGSAGSGPSGGYRQSRASSVRLDSPLIIDNYRVRKADEK